MVGDLVDGDDETGPHRRRCAEHEVVPVAPRERAAAPGVGRLSRPLDETLRRHVEVHPPHCEQGEQAADDDRRDVLEVGVEVERGLHADRRSEHRFAEHDDREQPVSLGDVPRVPGRPPGRLCPCRHGELERDQHEVRDEAGALGQGEAQHPADLEHRDAEGVAQRAGPAFGMLRGCPQPQPDHGQAHHHVPERDDAEVLIVERSRNPRRQDQHPGHQDEHGQPVGDIVVVVGGGEPGEVHPGPPDGEEHQRERQERIAGVTVHQPVVEAVARLGDCHDEGQVEEQLQRGGRPVFLVGVAGRHRCEQRHVRKSPAPFARPGKTMKIG